MNNQENTHKQETGDDLGVTIPPKVLEEFPTEGLPKRCNWCDEIFRHSTIFHITITILILVYKN
jgi:hypothetical protein